MNYYKRELNHGANQNTIKHANRGIVFDVLNTLEHCSRTELSRITGLTKTSITNITAEMIGEGIISEGEAIGSGVGRKQVLLEISSKSPCTIGVSINRDAVFVSLINLRGDVQFEKKLPLAARETGDSFLEKVFEGCDAAIASYDGRPLGIGVASIGPLNLNTGTILSPPNFRGIKNVEIVSALKQRYSMTVCLDNDMSAGATLERLFGYGKNLTNFIFIGVSRGIGAGVILDKKLYTGSNGFAGEIGHICINYKGRQCECGNRGCLETYASITTMEKEARRRLAQGVPSILSRHENVSWSNIVAAAREGDSLAMELIGLMTQYLAIGITALCNMHDPQVIFLGYEGAEAADLIIEPLGEIINQRIFSKEFCSVDIKPSYYGVHSQKFSGAAVFIHKFVNGEVK